MKYMGKRVAVTVVNYQPASFSSSIVVPMATPNVKRVTIPGYCN